MPELPEVWGRIQVVEGVKKLESVVALKPGETDLFVESALDSHVKWKWKLRLLDLGGRPVVEADLNPLIGPRTLQGTLRLGPISKGRTLTAEFVIVDPDGRATRRSPLPSSSRAWRARRSRWSSSKSPGATTCCSSSIGRSLPMPSRRSSNTHGAATTTARLP